MREVFSSHTWIFDVPLIIALAAGRSQVETHRETYTYQQALWWGAAYPGDPDDTSGCFSSNRTFEQCCVSWTEPPNCWRAENLTYESCCVAKQHWAPRSFSCNSKGPYWQQLHQTLALFRVFTELNETPLNKASPRECFIGGVLASILSLIHLGQDRQYRTQEQKDQDYERAEDLLLVLFRSPVTLEEILVSGWPLFLSLDLFRTDEGFRQMAQERLPLEAPGEHTLKWADLLIKSIQHGQGSRIAVESVIRLGKLGKSKYLAMLGNAYQLSTVVGTVVGTVFVMFC